VSGRSCLDFSRAGGGVSILEITIRGGIVGGCGDGDDERGDAVSADDDWIDEVCLRILVYSNTANAVRRVCTNLKLASNMCLKSPSPNHDDFSVRHRDMEYDFSPHNLYSYTHFLTITVSIIIVLCCS